MRLPLCRRAVIGALVVLALVVPSAAAGATGRPDAVASSSEDAPGLVPGLPAGAAAAARDPEPALPVPKGWAFPDAFSATSGTGRLIGGAFEWSDWVYDAYGAAGPVPVGGSSTGLSEERGSYTYPSGSSDGDGADIFRAAVGLTSTATVWRVDWNTLADPAIPIAEWTFDTDDDPGTGGTVWPAGANVSSPGIDKALVVSAKGAELIDAASGRTIASFPTTVDTSARSFLVTVPRSVLPVAGDWRIRLAAGLADPTGTGFAVPSMVGGLPAPANAPRVYNVTFRTAAQEPPVYAGGGVDSAVAGAGSLLNQLPVVGGYGLGGVTTALTANSWGEADQAETLAGRDVSKFSAEVDWAQLADRAETTPPLVTGWSDRWYVTDLNLGQGSDVSGLSGQLLGRIQPYAVYIPTGYRAGQTLPLTWLLHAAGSNYNEYAGSDPRLVQEACQDRDSICVTTEGFGPTGYYVGDAEHDFWQVWRQVALAFPLDPTRTVISGYSMGGLGTFVLASTYPSDFSEAMPLDGGFDQGCSTLPEGASEFVITAAPDRTANDRWVPMVISNSYTDELSPYPLVLANILRYVAAGDRFTLFSTTGGEHILTLLEDGFSAPVAALNGDPQATTDPGTIDYTWCPEVVDPTLGLGPSSVYWLSGLSQRTATAGTTSHVVADDGAIPEPAETEQVGASVVVPPDAPPAQVLTGTWNAGAIPPATPTLALTLSNVATLTVDTAAAKLPSGTATVRSDGSTVLTLSGLAPGTVVRDHRGAVTAGANGRASLSLPAGSATVSWT